MKEEKIYEVRYVRHVVIGGDLREDDEVKTEICYTSKDIAKIQKALDKYLNEDFESCVADSYCFAEIRQIYKLDAHIL